ncbi:hypothetical protein ILUMI_03671, partial [Ignelater luminosus]
IHAPKEVLRRYGEILKLRLPMKEILGKQIDVQPRTNFIVEGFNTQCEKIKSIISVDQEKFPERGHRFTAIYSRDREYLFDVDSPCFFTPAIHSRIVQFILDRKRFSDNPNDDFSFGIERLLNENIYTAAYPLHDGDLNKPGSMRKLLYTEWAAVKRWYRYQPLDYVKEYFGVKIALYFAWLGFYTHMLMPASVVGLLCFLYSCISIYHHKPSNDVCNPELNITMCPQCDNFCYYWDLSAACTQARITYLFDNASTVFFAIFMSIWAVTFLELWKRYSAEITHRWDLTGFDVQEEHPRPQYLARLSHVKRKQLNIITNSMEPHVPFWRMRVPATIFSFSVVLLLVALAFAAVAAVVLYRMSLMTALRLYGKSRDNSSYVMFFTNVTAACINLCCIVVFNWMYSYLAEYLTELEFIRTQTQFDDSLTLKIYLLQFVNYYASIFYIAFFKGKFVGHPKEYNRFLGHRQEECALGGCLLELCIQLGIIMIGKQAMNTVLEMCFPLFFKWMNTLKFKAGLQKEQSSYKTKPQWVKDYKLVEWGPRSLFPEYLEMVLQYGFVTIFVAAFPLAPLFALLNNILEMRLDARKLLTYYRRPVTQRVRDIGVWYRILDSIGKLSVITNGLIIAFTSNFIPRLVYRFHVSKHFSLNGFLNHSLSVFNTSEFEFRRFPDRYQEPSGLESYKEVPICRYVDYREPPGAPNEYEHSALFWHILAARLAFVVIFENVVACVIILVKWLIPDVPRALRDQIRRENYLTNEIIIKQEALRATSTCEESKKQFDNLKMIADVSPPITRRVTLGVGACPVTPDDWDLIIDRSLSESEVDLVTHSNTFPSDSQSKSNDDAKTPTSV